MVASAVSIVVAADACGGSSPHATVVTAAERVRALRPPRTVDVDTPGAAYLAAVAARVQPAWAQFLADCRMRLPPGHALNNFALIATVELVIEASGGVSGLDLTTSGVADFDHAAQDAVIDASPLPAPPLALRSDDDRVHIRWLFARDDRQAGPATAQLVHIALPVGEVVARLVAAGELGRAAQRIAVADAGDPGIEAATDQLVVGTLREALVSADTAVRRAAVDAIARGRTNALAGDVRGLLADTNDTELRLVAIDAIGALGDVAAAPELARDLAVDLPAHPRLALAEARALVALGRAGDVATGDPRGGAGERAAARGRHRGARARARRRARAAGRRLARPRRCAHPRGGVRGARRRPGRVVVDRPRARRPRRDGARDLHRRGDRPRGPPRRRPPPSSPACTSSPPTATAPPAREASPP